MIDGGFGETLASTIGVLALIDVKPSRAYGFAETYNYQPLLAGVQMTEDDNHDFERRVDRFYTKCEWVMLRTLVFVAFAYEVGKFVYRLWR